MLKLAGFAFDAYGHRRLLRNWLYTMYMGVWDHSNTYASKMVSKQALYERILSIMVRGC